MPKTMFDKIWDAHEVADGLIYFGSDDGNLYAVR